MSPSQLDYLATMGIQFWQEKHPASFSHRQNTENLISLCTTAAQCTACTLHKTRTQTVFGAGNPAADLMFISEAPGLDEDQTGEPLMGHAGQLFDLMLQAMGLDRSNVYITSLLKCRLPDDRDPLQEQINQCNTFLTQQISLIQPKILFVLGQTAAQYLLDTQASLEDLRGQLHSYQSQIPLVATYHPAHLLLHPKDKSKAWQDLQMIHKVLRAPCLS